MSLPTKPAQYRSVFVGFCTRSMGNVSEVAIVPDGVGSAALLCCPNKLSGRIINPTRTALFMTPPRTFVARCKRLSCLKQRMFQSESNKHPMVGQGYAGLIV